MESVAKKVEEAKESSVDGPSVGSDGDGAIENGKAKEVSSEDAEKAEEFKTRANECFKGTR